MSGRKLIIHPVHMRIALRGGQAVCSLTGQLPLQALQKRTWLQQLRGQGGKKGWQLTRG